MRPKDIYVPKSAWEVLLSHFLNALLPKRRGNIQLPDLKGRNTKPRSVFIRHLDCGSCNGCELELNALSNPVYDIEQYGIGFEASPRHADVLAMTGPFTRNLAEAAGLTLEAMPVPRVIAVGDCAINGGIFRNSYAVMGVPETISTVTIRHIPGCPPSPEDILLALLDLPTDLRQ